MTQKIIFLDKDLDIGSIDNVISVAIDTETTGLNLFRDRLCLVQLCFNDERCYLIQIKKDKKYPNLCKLLNNKKIKKIFHYGRFDIAMLYRHFNILTHNVFCTKIASKLIRTYTDKHGLPNLCRELLSVELSKEQQSSDWGADTLSESQKHYAASDVIYLHGLHDILQERLIRENRYSVAEECFKFLPFRAKLDCMGWEYDIFDWGTKY